MEVNGKAAYFIAVKLLIRDGNKLLITRDVFSSWDMPGGRIKDFEFGKPLADIANRKISEELGEELKIEIGEPSVFFSVKRLEHGIDDEVSIFAVGLEAKYLGGSIEFGENHNDYQWVDINDFEPEKYFENGWEKGLREYIDKSGSSR